ncbi:hypothetical protein AB6E09_10800 [Vibrio lentus]
MNSSRVAIQVLAILSGVFATFLMPILYGLDEYGNFLRLAIISFIVHRFVDVMNEPQIVLAKTKEIFLIVLINGLSISFITWGLREVFHFQGLDLPLLISLVVSSAYINYLYKLANNKKIISYYIIYIVIFILIALVKNFSLYELSISFFYQVVAWGTIITSIFIFGLPKIKTPEKYSAKSIKNTGYLIGFAFSNMFFSYLFLYLMMDYMDNKELGGIRVILALVQSAVLIYPINMKFIQLDLGKENQRTATLKKHIVQSSILFIGGSLLFIALLSFDIRFVLNIISSFPDIGIKLIISITPMVFISYLLERYHSANKSMKYILISILFCYIPFFTTLYLSPHYITSNMGLLLILIISTYACILAFFSEKKVFFYSISNAVILTCFYFSERVELLLILVIPYILITNNNRRKI